MMDPFLRRGYRFQGKTGLLLVLVLGMGNKKMKSSSSGKVTAIFESFLGVPLGHQQGEN